jgi:integrase/recombinase XerD
MPPRGGVLGEPEEVRHNSPRTRNNRLAALRSFFSDAALRHREHAASIQRVLAIQPKRYQRNLVSYLTEDELGALLGACDERTWTGRRRPCDVPPCCPYRPPGLRARRLGQQRPSAWEEG